MTMIQLILIDGKEKLFTNYNDVCHYLNTLEKDKNRESGEAGWTFVRRQYESLSFTVIVFKGSFCGSI